MIEGTRGERGSAGRHEVSRNHRSLRRSRLVGLAVLWASGKVGQVAVEGRCSQQSLCWIVKRKKAGS